MTIDMEVNASSSVPWSIVNSLLNDDVMTDDP